MSVAIDFDPNTVPNRPSFDPIPAGKYKVVITESEEKQTKKGDGSYVQFTLTIIDGEYEGRKLWDRLNLNNPNDQAVMRARGTLKQMAIACNVKSLKDTGQLHDIPMIAKIILKANKETGEQQNEIRGYEPVNHAAQPVNNHSKPPAMSETASAPTPPPWKKMK
jgi:hypothetical protein